jgi:transposase-like protein
VKINSSSDSEKEVLELKKKLREVEMERDILKKAALIFGRGS